MASKRALYSYDNSNASVRYIMDKLVQIDRGKYVDLDFIATDDVGKFCKIVGFEESWAGKTLDDFCITKEDGKEYGPKFVRAAEAKILLDLLKKMIRENAFKSRDGKKFDKTIINDFLPKSYLGFQGEKTLGHLWEFQYALQVELEHGRTRGTNVTNNHPLLTALVVMAHIAEDKCYYARLWVMEAEGEIENAVNEGKKADEIAKKVKELQIARLYLGKRLAEKAEEEGVELPA